MKITDKLSWTGGWWLAYQMLREKNWVPAGAGMAVSLVWILSAAVALGDLIPLYKDQAEIRILDATEEERKYAVSLPGVNDTSWLYETDVIMTEGDDTQPVHVYGVEESYFNGLADTGRTAGINRSEGMAYALFHPDVFSQQGGSNNKEEGQKEDTSEKELMDTVLFDADYKVRLYGLLSEDCELKGMVVMQEWVPGLADEEESGRGRTLLLSVESGLKAESIVKKLKEEGTEYACQKTQKVDEIKGQNDVRLKTGLLMMLCSIWVMVYEKKLWKERNHRLLYDLKRFLKEDRYLRSVLRKRRILILLSGLLGSVIWQWISVIFGWI